MTRSNVHESELEINSDIIKLAIFLSLSLSPCTSQLCQAVWLKDVTDAVCTAVNAKYNLLTFGREKLVKSLSNCGTSRMHSLCIMD